MRRHPFAVLLALVVVCLLAVAPPAMADLCENQILTDGEGINWQSSDQIDGLAANADAYERTISPYFERDFNIYYLANDQFEAGCAFEDGGRELRYPAIMVGDLEVSGAWFVPPGDPAFQRSLLILRNPNAYPASLTPFFYQGTEWGGANTDVVTTASGDASGGPEDDWVVVRNGADLTDPRVAYIWNFGSADRRASAREFYEFDGRFDSPVPPYTGGENPTQRFDRVVVPPGGTVAYLAVGLRRPGDAAAEAAARELQAAPEVLLAGLSDDEKRALLNVGLPDRDLDGVANAGDNCPDAVNADQANLDGDAQGDACDDDVDGDTIANAAEAARGTDPRKADSDGDGKRDDADACPVKAGLGADGCARFDELPLAPDVTKPGATILRVGATMRLRAFRRGVPCVVELTEAAAVACRLLVRATRVARIAAAGDLEVAAKSLPLAAGRRSTTLKPKRRLIRQRRFRATLQVTATDAAGNRTVKTKRFRVR